MKRVPAAGQTARPVPGWRFPSLRRGAWPVLLLVVAGQMFVQSGAFAGPAPVFSKAFSPAVIGPGSSSTLTFRIENPDPTVPLTDLSFTDALPAGMTVAAFPNIESNCGGAVIAASGSGTITVSGGSLGVLDACTISVDVSSSTVGTHMNVSGELTSSLGSHGTAFADLVVSSDRPGFSKAFVESTALFGERATLVFTVDNTTNPSAVSTLNFIDRLPPGLRVASPSNAWTDCEQAPVAGTLQAVPGGDVISYSYSGNSSFPAVAAGSTCTVSVDVDAGALGALGNASEDLNVNVAGSQRSSGSANAVLQVVADTVAVVKSFRDDPVPAGSEVTLEFRILNRSRTDSATGIGFSDDLDAALSGLVASGLPQSGVCGPGSLLSGASVLTLSGGQLEPGGSCSFAVTLQVPAAAPSGAYPNEAGKITADLGGGPNPIVADPPYGARDVLFVAPVPLITKTFTDDPVGSGGTATLAFMITNSSDAFPANGIAFRDPLDAALTGPLALPPDGFCGPGSSLVFVPANIDPATLNLVGGSLAAGESCAFEVELEVSSMASSGAYRNATSPVTATVNGEEVSGPPAIDSLDVVGSPQVVKRFLIDPVAPGGTTMLEFTISNDSNGQLDQDEYDDFSNILLSDDLDAVLPGLVASGLPQSDVCGAGSSLSGIGVLALSDGSVPAAGSCTFTVDLSVPADATPGLHVNTTGPVTATARGLGVEGRAASDTVEVAGLVLSKTFTDDPVPPGGTVTLEFTIRNVSALAATGIGFTDKLGGVIQGLVATGLPASDICGAGSILAGTSTVSLQNGNLAAGASCTFAVALQLPANVADGSYPNSTGSFGGILGTAPAVFSNANDNLIVQAEPSAPVTVSVNKSYAGSGGQGPEVSITLICPGATIVENGGVDVPTIGGVATFTLTAMPSEGTTCSATEAVPDGYELVSNDCAGLAVAPGDDPGPSCTIVNAPITTLARFQVSKVFSDSPNPTPVTVRLQCTTGLPLAQSFVLRESQTVNFVVTNFVDGALSCTVSEDPVAGYATSYAASGPGPVSHDGAGCHFAGVSHDAQNACQVTNQVEPVAVTISKEWVIHLAEGDAVDMDYRLTLYCTAPIASGSTNCAVGNGTSEVVLPAYDWCLEFDGDGPGAFSVQVTPEYPQSQCTVMESATDAGVEVDNGCERILISAGRGAQCTVTNTVFFAGIPTLSRQGLALLTMLVLLVGLVAMRRFL